MNFCPVLNTDVIDFWIQKSFSSVCVGGGGGGGDVALEQGWPHKFTICKKKKI